MNVYSVKNLNGETFSAVQDAALTDVVQTNSANWEDATTVYQTNSASYLTSHQAISAGPGIKIDDSTPGVIKVSNDETVLYESTAQTSALSFSEPLTAFERVLVCAGQVGVGRWGYTYLNPGDTNKYYAGFVRFIGGNNPVQIGGCVLNVNSQHTSGNLTPCGRRWLPTTTNAGGGDTNQFYFTKVIGINRKQ